MGLWQGGWPGPGIDLLPGWKGQPVPGKNLRRPLPYRIFSGTYPPIGSVDC